MYQVLSFERANGERPYEEFLALVKASGRKSYEAKVRALVGRLREEGFVLADTEFIEKIEGDLWQLRPGPFRIFFFWHNSKKAFILLNGFWKKKRKTPEQELSRAKRLYQEALGWEG